MTKLYCYVDESGQDTQGELFIVAVIVVGTDARDELIASLEVIEQETMKGRLKWSKTNNARRIEYIRNIVRLQLLVNKISFDITKQRWIIYHSPWIPSNRHCAQQVRVILRR